MPDTDAGDLLFGGARPKEPWSGDILGNLRRCVELLEKMGPHTPLILKDQIPKRLPLFPTHFLQHWFRPKLSWIPDAQVGNELNANRQPQQLFDRRLIQDANPANADAFRSSRQP